MKLAQILLLTVVITTYVGASFAQTQTRNISVYRCGPDGRDLRDTPCPSHAAASTSQLVFDQPSAGQAQANKDIVAADAKRAHELEKERLKKETEANRHNRSVVGIDGLKPTWPAPAAASTAKVQAPVSAKAPKPPKPPKPPTSPKPAKNAAEAG